jgi:2-aminobenzoate-CoA ligase
VSGAPQRDGASAHVDGFARERLPPRALWPQLRFDLPELGYAERLNCAAALLDRQVAAGRGGRIALRSPEGAWTYAELLARVNRIARVLVDDLALVPGNRVLLHGANAPMLAACWLAVVKAGGIAVTSMPLLRAKELGAMIDRAQVSHALCDAALAFELELARTHCPSLGHVLYFHGEGGLEARMRLASPEFAAVDTWAEDICIIAFTSGTTGAPKGTMHFHRDVLAICDCFPRALLAPREDDIFCGTPPLAFTFGLGGLLLFPLRYGASALLLPRPAPEALLAAIARERATILFTAPTFYRALAGLAGGHDLGSLRLAVSAGEALPAATRRSWREATGLELIDGIGTTELLHIFVAAAGADARDGTLGRAVPGYEAAVLDEAGRPAAPGVVGRLAVKGPTGCRYLDDERQRAYVQDGWNLTGDAASIDAQGRFRYHARSDELIISGGYNISGLEVEEVLLAHPAVAECGVAGLPDEARGSLVTAFVVLRPPYAPAPELVKELQEWVKHRIAPYKYPRRVEFVAELPRTGTGKLQRLRLRPATPPQTP